MRSVLLLFTGLVLLSGCERAPPTRSAVAAVEQSVADCTKASADLAPYLKAGDRLGAEQAATSARNICSTARATITRVADDRLAQCRAAVDLQGQAQSAELKALDGNMAPAEVAALLDQAIAAQQACAAQIHALP